MPMCYTCTGTLRTGSSTNWQCSGPDSCQNSFHIYCLKNYLASVSSKACCRLAINKQKNIASIPELAAINRSKLVDGKRSSLNCSLALSDESLEASSPIEKNSTENLSIINMSTQDNSILSNTVVQTQSQTLVTQSQPVTTLSSTSFGTSSPIKITTCTTTTTASINTPISSFSEVNSAITLSTADTHIPSNLPSSSRIIEPLSMIPLSIIPPADQINFQQDSNTPTVSSEITNTWEQLDSSQRQTKIMNGIDRMLQFCENFSLAQNQIISRQNDLQQEVQKNREYISSINTDIQTIDNATAVAINALKNVESDVHAHKLVLNTSDTQFLSRESVLSGIPVSCKLTFKQIIDSFLFKIGANHFIADVANIRELKPKLNPGAPPPKFFSIIILWKSFTNRKDVMDIKRKYGKITYQDIFQNTLETPEDANKILHFKDLLQPELHRRVRQAQTFFKGYQDISITCDEGQYGGQYINIIFVKKVPHLSALTTIQI